MLTFEIVRTNFNITYVSKRLWLIFLDLGLSPKDHPYVMQVVSLNPTAWQRDPVSRKNPRKGGSLSVLVQGSLTVSQTSSSHCYIYCILEIYCVGKFWRKCRLEGVLNIYWVLFSLFHGLSMKTYSKVYFSLCLFFCDFKKVANSAKINPRKKFPMYDMIEISSTEE